ncbi:hypothetical protein BZG36_04881 [Bifiguratus adelaidae]|uniref:FAD-binding FR-type domain-containing protein n=1 Tax=Bifiguratus adelaidae TaxID=1938954 RepID=A0A261XVW9_9FUNG|nr:hypothetical protein BZG36_04881 [Bifiguratus adelaidae]
MATIIDTILPWNEGEGKLSLVVLIPTEAFSFPEQLHKVFPRPEREENPTSPFLSAGAARLLSLSSCVAVGTLDEQGRPWVSVIGGHRGFARGFPPSNQMPGRASGFDAGAGGLVGMSTFTGPNDPILRNMTQTPWNGEKYMVAGLGFLPEARNRVKLFGHVAQHMTQTGKDGNKVQFVWEIEQSLGNCPKYIWRRSLSYDESVEDPDVMAANAPIGTLDHLTPEMVDLIHGSDTFFIATRNGNVDMDTNHRGGPVGFVRVLPAFEGKQATTIVYPEYSGNRLYQSLGNMMSTPLAGLAFPNFSTGDILYVTGVTKIHIGSDAERLLPRSNLAVEIKVTSAILAKKGLAIREQVEPTDHHSLAEPSPYNPPVRYLISEHAPVFTSCQATTQGDAIVTSVQPVTKDVARITFNIEPPSKGWKEGQYAILDFRSRLDHGYRHMNDEDPRRLNDDFIRSFTIASTPSSPSTLSILFRKVGIATDLMYHADRHEDLRIPIIGFDGSFSMVEQRHRSLLYIAGGLGITPLLSQFDQLDSLKVIWAVRTRDLDLVKYVLNAQPRLREILCLYVTGTKPDKEREWKELGVPFIPRRIEQHDISAIASEIKDNKAPAWFVCAPPLMKRSIIEWIGTDGEVFSEDFEF